MKPLHSTLLVAATAPAFGQVVDTNFTETSPLADIDLCVVREQAHGAGGVDLTPYGLPGVHDYVQSIYVRAAHDGVASVRGIRGRLVFPAGVTPLMVIDDAIELGGSAEDGVMTMSDADFGLAVPADQYSGTLRGLEADAHSEHACVEPGGIVNFYLFPRTNDVDDFRVIIDYGASFPVGLSFDIELWYDDATEDFVHERGIQVGDPLGGPALASGDYGEVNGIQEVPLTSALLPPTTEGRELDMSSGILMRRNGGAASGNHLELYDPAARALATHARRNAGGKMTRGLHGKVYAKESNLPGFVVIDLEGGGLGSVYVPGATAPSYVAGVEGSNELVLLSQQGAAAAIEVSIVDIPSATVTAQHMVTAGDANGLRGAVVAGGMIHMIALGGEYVRMNPVTGAYTVTALTNGNDSYLDMDVNAAGTTLYLLRSEVIHKTARIDLIDVASGIPTYIVVHDPAIGLPAGITRDGSGDVWIMSSGHSELEMATIAAYETATWTRVHINTCGANAASHHMLGDVNPDPLYTRYCSPAVANVELGRPGWITAFGSKTVADNDFHLVAMGLSSQQFGIIANAPAAAFIANPGGSNGNLCLGGAIGRFATVNTGIWRTARVQVDLNAQPRPAGPTAVMPGETWYYQMWYREGQNGSNFTDAIGVTFN